MNANEPPENVQPLDNNGPAEAAGPPAPYPFAGPPAPYPLAGPPAPYPLAPPGPYPFVEPALPAPRRRRARILVPVALVVVLGILVAVSIALTNSPGGNGPGTARHAASPSVSLSPTGPPLTPEAYQAALDAFTAGLGKGFAGLDDAHTPGTVGAAIGTLHEALVSALLPLKTLFPPDALREPHHALVRQLETLGDELLSTQLSTLSSRICGGSSAAAEIARSGPADGLRATIQNLATADPAHAYKMAQFLPPSTPVANRQLGNGNLIKKPRGVNTVKVENRYPNDVVISMAPAGSKNASLIMYVRSGQTASANSVPDGTYDVFLARGADWDAGAKAFTRDCGYQKFDQTVALKSTSRQYTVETFTLGVTDGGGNLKSDDADPGSFPG